MSSVNITFTYNQVDVTKYYAEDGSSSQAISA